MKKCLLKLSLVHLTIAICILLGAILSGAIVIPINPQWLAPWLADNMWDHSLHFYNVSIIGETSEGVILEWHGVHFLVENTPNSHDLILQTPYFHQLYPDSMSVQPHELDAMGIGGPIPTKCLGIKGKLLLTSDWKPSWQGGENLWFLNLPPVNGQPCYHQPWEQ